MRAGWRFGIAALAAASIFGSAPALAQDAPATNTATPPPAETVGPRELRDFSLPGTVTRRAPPPEPSTAPRPATPTPRATSPAPRPATRAPVREPAAAPPRQDTAARTRPPASNNPLAPFTIEGPLPPDATPAQPAMEPAPAPATVPAGQTGAATDLPTNYLPFLFLALIVGAGALYHFRRQRPRESYASASAAAFTAPEPAPPQPQRAPVPRPEPLQRTPTPRPEPLQRAPAPKPEPAVRPAPQPDAPIGLVTTSLRPWLDIEFSPGRCVIEDDKATIQFDVSVFNSGSAPARDVLIEASMFNAGPAQDQEISAFFAHPKTKGDRIPAIPPLKRVALKSNVSLTREQLRQFEVAGRKLFVPLVGVNALYRWGGGEGQTSASYVVGRDTQGEKMAPLRLDLGPRVFRGLGARPHDVRVRN